MKSIEGNCLNKHQNLDDSKMKSEELFHILGKKWTLPVLRELAKNDTMGFNQVKNCFQKITPTTLSSVLKILEQYDVVKKKIHDALFLSVSYSLTDYGKTLYEFSIIAETISNNSTLPVSDRCLKKISILIKNFTSDHIDVSKNEIRKYLIPLATLASIGFGICTVHGIQHLEHLTSFS